MWNGKAQLSLYIAFHQREECFEKIKLNEKDLCCIHVILLPLLCTASFFLMLELFPFISSSTVEKTKIRYNSFVHRNKQGTYEQFYHPFSTALFKASIKMAVKCIARCWCAEWKWTWRRSTRLEIAIGWVDCQEWEKKRRWFLASSVFY